MLSRSSSPTKSLKRQALLSKDNNVRLSPTKSLKTSNNCSPGSPKSHSISRAVGPGFVIYSDPNDYSTEFCLSGLNFTNENEVDKENVNVSLKHTTSKSIPRNTLGDLNINEFPGFVEYESSRQQHKLQTKWTASFNKFTIPSYVTPPRKCRMNYTSQVIPSSLSALKRSSSVSNLRNDKVIKKLAFNIHEDNIALPSN